LTLSIIWKILFYGWTASEVGLVLATRTRRSAGKLSDRGSIVILWVTIVGSIFGMDWIHERFPAPMFPGAHWLRYAAVGLMIAGLILRWTAILSLGKAFSVNVAIRTTQTLYQSGLYRFVRHPSYSGMVVCFVAIALAGRNWYSAAELLAATTAAILYRIHVEEAALLEAFGAQYAAYRSHTWRLIPGIY
jgi:protein-S-isoprenylcysteine O-methyltransferase Ste14